MFRFANRPEAGVDPATKEALRYRTALYQGFKALESQPLSTRSAIDICRTIKGVELDIRATPGTALLNEASSRVVYTPPEGAELLRDKLANWGTLYPSADGVDPLIRLAIMHYQFEAIHPFTDGNGRTGRVLNLLSSSNRACSTFPSDLSRYIIDNKKAYYDGLLAVTTVGAWEPWILFMFAAIRDTATWSTAKIRAICNLLDATTDRIRRDFPKIYSRELAEIIFVNPYCRIADLVSAGIAKRQSASVYLKALASLGILCEIEAGREKIYTNPALLTLLSDRGATEDAS